MSRILGDAIAMAGKSDALLRQALAKAGVAVPADVNLELAKYVNKRGVKPLNCEPKMEFADPFGTQEKLTPRASMGLEPVAASAPAKPDTPVKSQVPVKTNEKK